MNECRIIYEVDFLIVIYYVLLRCCIVINWTETVKEKTGCMEVHPDPEYKEMSIRGLLLIFRFLSGG